MIAPRYDEDVERAVGAAFLSLMRAVQHDMSVLGDLRGLAALLAREGARLLGDTECLVALFEDDQAPRVRAFGACGAWVETHGHAVWPREGTLAGLCAETSQPLEISRVEKHAEPREPLNGGPMGTVRMIPVVGAPGAAPLGVLGIYRWAPAPLSPSERALVDAFAILVGTSLQRAVAREEARHGEARLRLGLDLALDLAASLQPAEVVSRLLRRAVEVTEADRGTLGRVDGGHLVIEEAHDREGLPSSPGSEIRLDSQPVLQQVMATRGPVRVARDRSTGVADHLGEPFSGGAHSLSIPLVVAGEVIAIMVLQRRGDPGFTAWDLQTAQVVGTIAGLALRNARLHESLQRVDQARDGFVSMVVHEMRSPLTVIAGYLEMMSSGMFGAAPEAWNKPLDTVTAKCAELQTLVDDLLFSSRLETGRLATTPRPTDLREVVAEVVDRASPRARLLNGRLHATLPHHPVLVETDASHVERILDNLVNNALNYGGEGPEVTIAVELREGARITVTDAGHGIHPDHQERIFERFYRVQDRTRHPGTGLGLFICRQLTERLGGSLAVERSVLGVGTTFALNLPMHPGDARAEAARGGTRAG